MIALKRIRPLPIGLQLGPRSATLVQLVGGPGRLEVHAMAYGEFSCDDDASPDEQDRQTAAALRKLIADHHFRGRHVVSCLGSQELFVQNVRLPQLPPDEIARIVPWEAEERLPYPVAEAELRHLLAGQVRQDANVKQEVILLACHRGIVARHIGVLEQAGLVPASIDAEPCAVLRSLRYSENRPAPSRDTSSEHGTAFGDDRESLPADDPESLALKTGSPGPAAAASAGPPAHRRAYLNLGERATTVIFVEGDRILFLKYMATGGEHLDRAVARHLDLDLSEAARMRAGVTAAPDLDARDDIHRTVIDAIRDPLESLVSEIELCLRYHKVTFRGKPLENIVITGSETSAWLAAFLSDRLGTPCLLGNPLEGLARPPEYRAATEHPWRWTTAMGLSMKDLSL